MPKELTVFDDEHPLPQDAVDADGLRRYMTQESDKQLARLMPKDKKTLPDYRRVLGTALRVMITDTLPNSADIEHQRLGVSVEGDEKINLGRKGQKENISTFFMRGKEFNGKVVVWIHPEGVASLWNKGKVVPAAQEIIDKKGAILAVDVFLAGSSFKDAKPHPISKGYSGFTFGYNRPLLANRVHDILTAVAYAKGRKESKTVDLVGFGKAGPWVALARGLCGNTVARTAADLDQFRFENIKTMNDEMMLPGALKYGGLPALTAPAAPHEIYLHNTSGISDTWLRAAYKASGQPANLHWQEGKSDDLQVIQWLLR
jgi:hypothetical protein